MISKTDDTKRNQTQGAELISSKYKNSGISE